ncbi:Mitochondrial GTPase 1 [Sorochytrium milnesiophthora]
MLVRLAPRALCRSIALTSRCRRASNDADQPARINWYPGHMASAHKTLSAMIKRAKVDMVVDVRDARMPAWQNQRLDALLSSSSVQRFVLFTQLDLSTLKKDKRLTAHVAKHIAATTPAVRDASAVRFVDARSANSLAPLLQYAIHQAVVRKRVDQSSSHSPFQDWSYTILVAGLPNVGKSTVINGLRALGVKKGMCISHRRFSGDGNRIKVYDGDEDLDRNFNSRHKGLRVYVMDTPGIIDPATITADPDQMLKIALLNGVKGSVAGEETMARHLLRTLQRIGNTQFLRVFGIPADDDYAGSDEACTRAIDQVARRLGAVGKEGVLQRDRAAKWMLDSFRTGKLGPVMLDDVHALVAETTPKFMAKASLLLTALLVLMATHASVALAGTGASAARLSKRDAPGQASSPCDQPAGICTPPGAPSGTQCIHLAKAQHCLAFTNYFIPTNLTAYLESRFPTYKSQNVPVLVNATAFDNLFLSNRAAVPWGFFGLYQPQYSVGQFGCTLPNQRWLNTWLCMDVLKSVLYDLNNGTTCFITPANKAKGLDYVQNKLLGHPWSKGGADVCIAGTDNEASFPSCGYPELLACQYQNCTMPGWALETSDCKKLLQDAATAVEVSDADLINDPNLKKQTNIPIATVFLCSIIGVVFISAMVALSRIRSRNGRAEAKRLKMEKSAGGKAAAAASEVEPLAPRARQAALAPPPSNMASAGYGNIGAMSSSSLAQPAGYQDPQQYTSQASLIPSSIPQPPAATTTTFVVTVPYTAQQPDEVTMRAGDQAVIEQDFGDGWGGGVNLTTGLGGVFPLTCFGQSNVGAPSSSSTPAQQPHRNQSLSRPHR